VDAVAVAAEDAVAVFVADVVVAGAIAAVVDVVLSFEELVSLTNF
jgi:hypothetical protein